MVDEEPAGWTPNAEAVKKSEQESEVASIIEVDSLSSLKEKATHPESNEEQAAALRQSRDDIRLEIDSDEHKRITERSDIIAWVLLGVVVGGSLVLSGLSYLIWKWVFS